MISVQLPDGSVKEYADGISAWDVASSIGQRLANACVAAEVNDKVVDLKLPLPAAGPVKLKLLTEKDAAALAVLRHLGLPDDADHVNPNGGAIALGHPLGMSGARLATTALVELERRGLRRALCTMCIGVGQGIALVLERV